MIRKCVEWHAPGHRHSTTSRECDHIMKTCVLKFGFPAISRTHMNKMIL